MIAWLAPKLAKAVLALAVTTLLLGIALAALGVHVASWPYRRLSGPSARRAMVEAGLGVLVAVGALVAALRATSPPPAHQEGNADRGDEQNEERRAAVV
jgi:hypothetical protein